MINYEEFKDLSPTAISDLISYLKDLKQEKEEEINTILANKDTKKLIAYLQDYKGIPLDYFKMNTLDYNQLQYSDLDFITALSKSSNWEQIIEMDAFESVIDQILSNKKFLEIFYHQYPAIIQYYQQKGRFFQSTPKHIASFLLEHNLINSALKDPEILTLFYVKLPESLIVLGLKNKQLTLDEEQIQRIYCKCFYKFNLSSLKFFVQQYPFISQMSFNDICKNNQSKFRAISTSKINDVLLLSHQNFSHIIEHHPLNEQDLLTLFSCFNSNLTPLIEEKFIMMMEILVEKQKDFIQSFMNDFIEHSTEYLSFTSSFKKLLLNTKLHLDLENQPSTSKSKI